MIDVSKQDFTKDTSRPSAFSTDGLPERYVNLGDSTPLSKLAIQTI